MRPRLRVWGLTVRVKPVGGLPFRAALPAVDALGASTESDDESDDGSQYQWLSQGGRDLAAAYLLPRAEAALRQKLQRLADAVKRAREGQSSSSSGWRAL